MNIGQQNIIIQISVSELSELIKLKALEAVEEYHNRLQATKTTIGERSKKELELVNVKVAAKILGRSENTIRSYVKDGTLNSYGSVGRFKILLSRQELEDIKENIFCE